MRKIRLGFLWFMLLLMNIGLFIGSVGFGLVISYYSPLVESGLLATASGIAYVCVYVLLLIGVLGLDYLVCQKGINVLAEVFETDA